MKAKICAVRSACEMTQVHFMSCLNNKPIDVVLGGWLYESAEGTMVVGRSCAAGAMPELVDVEAVEVSASLLPSVVLLSLSELCEPVCAGWAADEVLLGARFKDCVLAYQYGLVVALEEAAELGADEDEPDPESSDDDDDDEGAAEPEAEPDDC